MKIIKKLGLFVCALVLSFSCFSLVGCGGDKEDYDFTIWCYQTDSSIRNYAESPAFKKLQEITGKKVKFILGTDSDNMLATKSYPEVCLWLGYSNGYSRGIADGVVKDITQLVYDHAPNYRKAITSDLDTWLGATTQDANGNPQIGAFYVINEQIEAPWRGYVMRKDFIEANKSKFTTYSDWEDLGEKDSSGNTLLTPTLYSHWEDIFKVAKDMYKADNKTGFKYPLAVSAGCYDSFDSLNGGYNIALGDTGFYYTGTEMKWGFIQDDFKDYLTMINKWYKAGYFTPNFSESSNSLTVSTAEILGTKKVAPTALCFPDIANYLDSRISKAHDNGMENYELMGVPNPRQSKDQTLHLINTNGKLGMSAAITTKCSDEKAKEIVEWFDYLYSEEGSKLMNYGVEGETYTVNADGTKTFCDGIKNNPDKGFYEYASYGFPTINDTTKGDMFKSQRALDAVKAWQYKNDGAWNLKSTATLTGADATEYSDIITTAAVYISESIPQFIKGTKSLNEFASYVNTLKGEYKMTRAVELRGNSYVAYNNRTIPDTWKVSIGG